MSGQAIIDGWQRIGLDDDFPIRQALPVGVRFWCWARWARFSMEKIVYYNRYNKFTPIPIAAERCGSVPLNYLRYKFKASFHTSSHKRF
jgi:hypothetical protein